ncbi:MAG: hypothetical protein RH860_08295 [Cytophagales bacterium]
MKTLCIIFFSFLIDASLLAFPAPSHQGVIVLNDGEVLVGEITNINNQLLLVVTDSARVVVPAHQLRKAQYFDEINNINRKFLPLSEHGKLMIYEVVVNGDISIVRIPRDLRSSTAREEKPSEFRYYLLVVSELRPFSEFSKSISAYMESRVGNLAKSYWRENRLNPHQISDAIQIVRYYNGQIRSLPYLADLQH